MEQDVKEVLTKLQLSSSMQLTVKSLAKSTVKSLTKFIVCFRFNLSLDLFKITYCHL